MAISSVTFIPARDLQEALTRAAAMRGIDGEYWDIFGKRHLTPPEVQKAILESMGIPTGALDEVNKALENHLWAEWSRIVPPAYVVSEQAPAEVAIRIPASLAEQSVSVRVTWEDGSAAELGHRLKQLTSTKIAKLRGHSFVE